MSYSARLSCRMPGSRMRRGEEAGREVFSGPITENFKKPRIGVVTVTGGDTSPNLRHARVYVSVLGSDEEKSEALEGLRSSAGFLQSKVGEQLRMKRTPTLEFRYDDSIDHGMRITELLDEREPGEWE